MSITLATNLSQNGLFGNMIRNQAVVRDGKLYIVYSGPSEDVYLLRANPDGTNVEGPHLVGVNPLPIGDAHGAPALWFDGQGRPNVFGACHVGPMKWWRANAGEITGWQAQADFGTGTYPCILNYDAPYASWATMFWRGVDLNYCYRQTENGGTTWRPLGQISTGASGTGDALYYDYGQGIDGSNHYCGCLYDRNDVRGVGPSLLYRLHDFFYYYSPPSGGFNRSDGSALPSGFLCSPANYGTEVRVLNSGVEACQIPVMELDANSKPHVLQTRGTGTACRIDYGRLVAGAWQWETITDCDDIADSGAIKILSDRVVVLLTRGGTGGNGTGTNARRGGNIERWERLNATGQWVNHGTILTAEPPLYWNQPVAVVGADAFIVGQQYDWPTWEASDKTWSGGRIELVTIGSTPPPPPPPVETWKRTGTLANTPGGYPVRVVNGLVESTDPTWTN